MDFHKFVNVVSGVVARRVKSRCLQGLARSGGAIAPCLFFGSVVHLYVTNTPISACSCFRCWAFSFVEAPLAFQVATESHVSGQKYAASGCFSVAVDFVLTLTCLLTCLRRLVLVHSGQQNASQYCQWRRKKVSRYPVRSLGHANSTSFIHSVFLLPCPGPIFTPPPSLRLVILRSRQPVFTSVSSHQVSSRAKQRASHEKTAYTHEAAAAALPSRSSPCPTWNLPMQARRGPLQTA